MEVNDNVLSYKSAYAHVFMDGDEVPVTGTAENGNLDVEAPTGTFANGSPDGINRQTPIANFNTGYLGALGSAGTEIALLLGVKCTPDQIANIVALKPTCSDKQIKKKDPNCACCLPDDLIGALNYGGLINEKVICDGLKDQLDAGAIDTFVQAATGLKNVTFASMDDASQMTARVNTFIAAGAVADADAYHAMDNHTKALFTAKMGFIAQSNLLASQGVWYATCASLAGACTTDLTGRPNDGSDITAAEMRTILKDYLAVGGTWPADNTNADTTSWTTTSWDAATDAVRDESIRVFSRYSAVNTPILIAEGSQAAADAFFGGDGSTELPLATRILVISGAAETDADSDGIFVPQNAFDAAAIRAGYATFSGTTEITPTAWAGMTEDEKEVIVGNTYYLALSSGLAAIGGEYCSCRGNPFNSTIPDTGCCLEKGQIPAATVGKPWLYDPADALDMDGFWCNNTVTLDYTGKTSNSTHATSASDGKTTSMDHAYWYATQAGVVAGVMSDVVTPPRSCNAFLSEDSSFVSLVSMLNDIDGGIAVKSSGDAARTDTGLFQATAFGNPNLHTGLIQTHSANDNLYGYPSALLGLLLPSVILGLQGEDDAVKKVAMADIATYTKSFNDVCGVAAGKCNVPTGAAAATPISYTCGGVAPSRSDISEANLAFADHSCKAASWTFSTAFFCASVEAGVHEKINALYAMTGLNLGGATYSQDDALEWSSEDIKTHIYTVVYGGAQLAGADATTAAAAADAATADLEAFYVSTTRSAVLMGIAGTTGKAGFIDQSNLLAKQGTMYGTCASLAGACTTVLTGRPTDGSDITAAEMRTIFKDYLTVSCGGTCKWPKDNTNADTTVWDTTSWDAATDTEKDESIKVFSRYNAVNTPILTAAAGNQAAADAAFGGDGSTELALATRIAIFSGAAETDADSDGIFVPQNAFDVGAILSGYATFSGTTVTSSEWAGKTVDAQEDIVNSVYFNAFNVGLAAIGGVPATGYQDYTSADDLEDVVEGYAVSLETFYCKCADGSDDHKTTGCCLSSGGGGGTDFTGFGCLYGLPGWFETNIANNDMEATMQRSKVIEGAKDATKQEYCPILSLDDASKLGEYVEHEGATSYDISSTYSETVQGGNGKFMEPQGLTTEAGDLTLSKPGTKAGEELKLFVSQVSRSLELGYSGSTELVADLVTAEFRPHEKLLWSTPESEDADAEKKLEGKTSALHPLSWEGTANVAPLQNGLPVYLSQVNFLNADPDLLDSSVNGIEIYHCFDYPESVAYPDTDAQGSQQDGVVISGPAVVDTTKCDRVTTEWLTENKNDVDVWLQVEPASGFTIAGHQRLMGSIAPTVDCDPLAYGTHEVYQACLLGFSATGDLGTCHSEKSFLLEMMDVGGVQAGVMIEGAIAASGKTYSPGFPCSSANLFTPGFKGGGLVPVFWLDKASELAPKSRQGLVDLGKVISIAGLITTAGIAAGVALVVIGALCVAKGGGNKVAANA